MSNSFNIDVSNFQGVSFQSPTPIEVYGWNDCLYDNVQSYINENKQKILSKPHLKYQPFQSNNCVQNSNNLSEFSRRTWKTHLTNIILENVARARLGQEIIPLIFITDREIYSDTPGSYLKNLTTPESVAEKLNRKITSAEMRRAYKLCFEMGDDEVSKEIMSIAHQTLHFAKICKDDEKQQLRLENSTPLWEREGWESAWQARMGRYQYYRPLKRAKKGDSYWREQSIKVVSMFNPPQTEINKEERQNFLDEKIKLKNATLIPVSEVSVPDDCDEDDFLIIEPKTRHPNDETSCLNNKFELVNDIFPTENYIKNEPASSKVHPRSTKSFLVHAIFRTALVAAAAFALYSAFTAFFAGAFLSAAAYILLAIAIPMTQSSILAITRAANARFQWLQAL